MLARLLDLDAGRVGGVGDVDDDRRVGLQREGARARAAEGGLLLGGRHRRELPRARRPPRPPAAPPRAPRRSRGGCRARARRAGRWAAPPARASITATSPIRTSSRACSPSRAPMSMCRSRTSATFLRSSSRSRWIGFLPTTPATRPVARVEHHALADEDLRVPAADLAEPQVALVVDVGDDQPDLVDVAHHEQPPRRAACRAVLRRHAARAACRRRSVLDLGERAGGRRARPRAGARLVARGAARAQQVAQHRGGSRSRGAPRLRGAASAVGWPRSCGEQPPQHVLQDAAVAEVVGLARRVDAHARVELDRLAALAPRRHLHRRAAARRRRPSPRRGRRSRTTSSPRQPERLGALARRGTAAAARPCRRGWSGGCARSSRAITARTPSSLVPLAAQSREEPEPYSLPASTTSAMPSLV